MVGAAAPTEPYPSVKLANYGPGHLDPAAGERDSAAWGRRHPGDRDQYRADVPLPARRADPRCRARRRHRPAAQLPGRRLRHLQVAGPGRRGRPRLGDGLRHLRRGEGRRQVPDLPEPAAHADARDPPDNPVGRRGAPPAPIERKRRCSRPSRSRPRSAAWCSRCRPASASASAPACTSSSGRPASASPAPIRSPPPRP